jgi:hypothetical protein
MGVWNKGVRCVVMRCVYCSGMIVCMFTAWLSAYSLGASDLFALAIDSVCIS